jgi:hypothetical protein
VVTGFVSSTKARAAVGLLNASGYATGFSVPWNTAALNSTTLADTAKAFIIGQNDWSMNIDMILDVSGAANGQFDVMHDWKATSALPVDFAPEGFTTGNLICMGDALQTSASTSAAVADKAMAAVSAVGTLGFDVGVAVEDFTAITATGNGTARDLTAETTNGGVAHLHVTAYSGLTSNDITIEHSVNGSTSWAVLVTFAQVTGLTSERVVVAAGTTVRRFLRVVDTVVGTGSCTRAVTFARR